MTLTQRKESNGESKMKQERVRSKKERVKKKKVEKESGFLLLC